MFEFLTLKPESFGLDISDLSLKIVKLKKKGKFLKLASYGKQEIKPGIIEGGEIKDEESLVKVIKESLNKIKGEKLRTNYVIASLPEKKAFVEVIQMPKMKEEELKEAVSFEAENHIPLPIEDVYLDFQVVQPFYNHLDHLDILIAALPKRIIDPYIACFKKAGLCPRALEVESLSIARALVKNEVSPHPILLIDFGATKTNLMVFSGHSLMFTHSASISSRDFTKAIAQEFDITFEEAEELKIRFGLEKEYRLKIKDGTEKEIISGRVLRVLDPLLNNLAGEIKKAVDYYQTHIFHEHLPPNNRGVEKVLLSGGGASLKRLPDFLTSALKMPVEFGNPWVNILKAPLREIPELSYEKSLSFATALGLGLRGIKEN